MNKLIEYGHQLSEHINSFYHGSAAIEEAYKLWKNGSTDYNVETAEDFINDVMNWYKRNNGADLCNDYGKDALLYYLLDVGGMPI